MLPLIQIFRWVSVEWVVNLVYTKSRMPQMNFFFIIKCIKHHRTLDMHFSIIIIITNLLMFFTFRFIYFFGSVLNFILIKPQKKIICFTEWFVFFRFLLINITVSLKIILKSNVLHTRTHIHDDKNNNQKNFIFHIYKMNTLHHRIIGWY